MVPPCVALPAPWPLDAEVALVELELPHAARPTITAIAAGSSTSTRRHGGLALGELADLDACSASFACFAGLLLLACLSVMGGSASVVGDMNPRWRVPPGPNLVFVDRFSHD